ncbi:MAG TPA: hypothetical protein P5121_24425, partial [Caldilineaceae bacterium]|nr:hypothetical protein [Caldilineaceae bacterium]
MRLSTSVLFGAVGAVLFAGVLGSSNAAEARIWTDDIPTGKPYLLPPLPARPRTEAQLQAAINVTVPVLEPLSVDPLRIGILKEITRLKAGEQDPYISDVLDALGSLYGGEMAGPFWVDSSGFVDKARQTAAEMERADDYALDPAQFNIPN